MKTKPASLVLVAVVALLQAATHMTQTGRGKQALNPPYLSQMPVAERVKAEVKGKDAMDTAARQLGAFWQVEAACARACSSFQAFSRASWERVTFCLAQRLGRCCRAACSVSTACSSGRVAVAGMPECQYRLR